MDTVSSLDIDLDPARIATAPGVIDEVFLRSPQFVDPVLSDAVGRPLVVKVETANPVRSFKGRGTEFLLHQLESSGQLPARLACASTGNFGQGLTYAARRRGVEVTVFVPGDVNPTKQNRMRLLGADVISVDGVGDTAEEEARIFAGGRADVRLVQDGREAAIAEGAGTIAIELLTAPIDTIVVPVGDGALISGIGCWVKAHTPHIRIIGVCASGSPSMAHSWRDGRPVTTDRADTIAEGIAVRNPVPESVARIRAVVDDMLLVDDLDMLAAIDLARECLGITLEPSGAVGLAALTKHNIPADLPATILTGANPRPDRRSE